MVCDFNLPLVSWPTEGVAGDGAPVDDRKAAEKFISFSDEHCLTQIVTEPTREMNILDLIFTNNEKIIHDCEVHNTSLSDHRMIILGMLQLIVPAIAPPERSNYYFFCLQRGLERTIRRFGVDCLK